MPPKEEANKNRVHTGSQKNYRQSTCQCIEHGWKKEKA